MLIDDARRSWFANAAVLMSLLLLLPPNEVSGQATFRSPRLPAHRTLRDVGSPQMNGTSSTTLRQIGHSKSSDSNLLEPAPNSTQEGSSPDESSGIQSVIVPEGFRTQDLPGIGSNAPGNSIVPLGSNFNGFTPSGSSESGSNWDQSETEAARRGLQDYLNGNATGSEEVQNAEAMEQLPEEMQEGDFSSGSASAGSIETIVQRFPNGKKRIVREVGQDDDGNFANHGRWEAFDQAGNSIAAGLFNRGIMQGQWRRQHNKSEGGLFATKPFNLYQGPFLSVANFKDGELEGLWTIYDQFRTKVFEISYKAGVREGTATWWYPNRAKMREAKFKNGLLNGFILGWDEAEKPTRKEEYIEGRRIVRNTTFYRPNQPKQEEYFLDSKLEPEGKDDWWKAQPTGYLERGSKVRNGGTAQWYQNGQLKKQGQFKDDEPVGRFIWWHQNGNKQIQGLYVDGQKNRTWTWWHANGMKKIEGDYKNNKPIGIWRAWHEDGSLRKEERFFGDEPIPGSKTTPTESDPDPETPSEPDSTQSVIDSAQPIEELPEPMDTSEIQGHDFGGENNKDAVPRSEDPFGESTGNDGSLPKELFENDSSNDQSMLQRNRLETANTRQSASTLKWNSPAGFDR